MEHTEKDTQENLVDNELVKCQADLQQWKESMLRVSADFENFKKRTLREKSSWIDEARADVLLDLLGIVDNFDRAFSQPNSSGEQSFNIWLQGFEMIRKSLYELLTRYEIKAIASGLPFDPQFHEAISQVDSSTVASGEVVETVQKGFLIKDRVLRPAKVVVAK